MDRHFLDDRELSWQRPATRQLHDLLKAMYPSKDDAIDALADIGFKNPEADFEFHSKMERSWRRLMEDLHKRQKLVDLILSALEDDRFVRYHDALRTLIAGSSAGVGRDSGTGAGLDWRGAPITSAGGFEKLLREGRSFFAPEFLSVGARVASAVAWIEARFANDRVVRGSGFLVGPDLVLTNHHVLHDEKADWAVATNVEVRFGYEASLEGTPLPWRTVTGRVDTIQGKESHDWAVIRLEELPGGDHRWIPLTSDAHIDIDEPVFIVQHPGGGRMVISVDPAGGVVRHVNDDRIQYLTETDEGSSGSPVFNRRWQVVALHHRWEEVPQGDAAEQRNQGVCIARVIEGLAEAGIDLGGDGLDPEPGLPSGSDPLQRLALRKAAHEPSGELPSAKWADEVGPDAESLRRTLVEHGAAGKGGFVALRGARGYGKFALARVVLDERAREGATILATSFVAPPSDAEEAASAALRERWPEEAARAGRAWLDLVGQAEAEIERKGLTLPAVHEGDGPAYLRALVRALAAEGPVFILLDELSRAEGAPAAWWQDWHGDLGAQIRGGVACVVVMTLPPAPFGWAAWVDVLLGELGPLVHLNLEIGVIDVEAARRHLSRRLDGAVHSVIADNLIRLADRVPVVFEDLVEWCIEARVPGPDGHPMPVITFDEDSAMWIAAPVAGDLVFENAHDAVLGAFDRLVPRDDESAWAAARGMMNRPDQPTPHQLRAALQHMLGCAALEGRRFTAEVVAATLGMDSEMLIEWLDEYLVRQDGTGLLEDVGFTVLTPRMGTVELPAPQGGGATTYLHHYWFTWPWQWRVCAKYFLDHRERARLTVGLLDALETQVPTMHRGAFAPAVLGLLALGSELQSRGFISVDRDDVWRRRAEEYRILGRYSDLESPALNTLIWHTDILDREGERRTPHQDRILLRLRLALSEGLLQALADGKDIDVDDPAAEAERAATLAVALDDTEGQARARTLDQAARLAGAIMATAPSGERRNSIRSLLDAGLTDAADAAGLDATRVPAEQREPLAGILLAILENNDFVRDARIAAGLCLGRIGDLRFERRAGPYGEYILPPLVNIPAGRYPIGSSDDPESPWFDPDGQSSEREADEVPIDSYSIGRYPVTNAEWACFMDAKGYEDGRWWTNPVARAWLDGDPQKQELARQYWRDWWREAQGQGDLDGWLEGEAARYRWSKYSVRNRRGIAKLDARQLERLVFDWFPDRPPHEPDHWHDARFNNPSQPVVGISWFEALAYCTWLSAQTGQEYRLPSEIQWEAAARGVAGRRFAFDDRFDPALTNTAESELERTTPVGAHPGGATPEGIQDLCGNVLEWTRSIWGTELDHPDFEYPYEPDDGREDEEAGAERLRVLRGGSWGDAEFLARAASRSRNFPSVRDSDGGFRLVCASPISVATES